MTSGGVEATWESCHTPIAGQVGERNEFCCKPTARNLLLITRHRSLRQQQPASATNEIHFTRHRRCNDPAHLGQQWTQVTQPILRSAEHDHRNAGRRNILLPSQIPIHRHEDREAFRQHSGEERAVPTSPPAEIVDVRRIDAGKIAR